MAISQNRYIDVSTHVNTDTVSARRMDGLVFSSIHPIKDDTDYTTNGKVYTLTLEGVLNMFGRQSLNFIFAEKYFGYISPSGNSPTALSFAYIPESSEDASGVFTSVTSKFEDFGSFCFLKDLTIDEFEGVKGSNSAMNGGPRLFCVTTSTSEVAQSSANDGVHYVHVGDSNSLVKAYIPMAITASIDYDADGGTTSFMYKRFPNDEATVADDVLATELDQAHVNYVGLVKANGVQFSFYQRGFNSDGTDTAIFLNEEWLKSEIAARYFNLITSINKIPANADGVSIVTNIIMDVISKARANGTIIIGKTLTSTERSLVFSLTGNNSAYSLLESQGYWLGVKIVKNANGEYVVKYLLVYSKGDSIRKVEGNHNLI